MKPTLSSGKTYTEVCERFTWEVPEFFNIGAAACEQWAVREPERVALLHVLANGQVEHYTYADLLRLSSQCAHLLESLGIVSGDRVAILLPQAPQTAYAHIAVYRMGAIALPLFTLFGAEALEFRLRDSGARCVITNREGVARLVELRASLPQLEHLLCIDGPEPGATDFSSEVARQSSSYSTRSTRAEDPALIIYTSGTTGPPKGALHAHRTLIGHLPGVEMSHNLLPQAGDRIWTPADWAWIGGLLDVLMPALYLGVPVVARRFEKFTGEAAFELMQDLGVRNAFLPPTALKMMRAVPDSESRWKLNVRSIASGGETLGGELLEWGKRVFGVTINEFYGQTECNMIVSSCATLMPARPGIMGRPAPGHRMAVVDDQGQEVARGAPGNIAVLRPDPVMFIGYWNNPRATLAKFVGDWLLTGDTGVQDEQGWLRFVGRDDDIITSAGYRIGPGEIEDCLLRHPAVRFAGVIGKPDPERTEIIKAYIVLAPGHAADAALADELKHWVRTRLAAHEYPREVDFVGDLPMTVTGKIVRRELRDRARRELAEQLGASGSSSTRS